MQVSVFIAPTYSAEAAEMAVDHLSCQDRARALDIKSEKRRIEFVSGRLLVRQSLASVYGEAAQAWVLETQASGALRLRAGTAPFRPEISLSHSHGRVACALANVPALGLDIEQVQTRKHLVELAGEALHPQEMNEFSQLDAAGKAHFFYAKWVLKEAIGKALGCGINYPMQEFLLGSGTLIDAPQAWISTLAHWRLSHTVVDGGYSLGLAWQGGSADSVSINTVEIRI